jgi:hypothetical protein
MIAGTKRYAFAGLAVSMRLAMAVSFLVDSPLLKKHVTRHSATGIGASRFSD